LRGGQWARETDVLVPVGRQPQGLVLEVGTQSEHQLLQRSKSAWNSSMRMDVGLV
jgi:hypothetical protein